jgi:hypothetical protein
MSTTPFEALQALADTVPVEGAAKSHNQSTNGTTPKVEAGNRFGQTALENELAILGATQPGDRNNQLFKSAAALGEVVAGGSLNRWEVESALESVALATGLDPSEIKSTIRSGIEKGMQSPRYPDNYSATLKREVSAERNNGRAPHDEAHHTDSGANDSAGTTGASAERKKDIFTTARAVAESTPEQAEWVSRPWVAMGGITEIAGPIKGGKTTWKLAMCRCVLDGLDFMGYPTMRGPVVYLTEQPAASFREGLRRADLLERDDFHILFWKSAIHLTWPQRVGVAVEKAMEVGAVLLVVDTLAWWAGLRGDEENSAGAALTVMEPLLGAVGNHPIGVSVLRHERKSGGEVGQSTRGSSAFGGSVDIVLALKRPEGNPGANPNMRVIHSLSRFDETPAELMVELTDNGYVAHGDVHAVAFATAKEAALEGLKTGKLNEHNERIHTLTFDELLTACEAKGVKRSTLQDALDHLCKQFLVKKTGAGKKGDPFRYEWLDA